MNSIYFKNGLGTIDSSSLKLNSLGDIPVPFIKNKYYHDFDPSKRIIVQANVFTKNCYHVMIQNSCHTLGNLLTSILTKNKDEIISASFHANVAERYIRLDLVLKNETVNPMHVLNEALSKIFQDINQTIEPAYNTALQNWKNSTTSSV